MKLSVLSVFEIILYSMLNFLPSMVLALYTFRNRLRFSKKGTVGIIGAATIVQLWLGIWACFFAGENKGIVSVISTLVYIFFYFLVIKADLGKTLFILLMLSHFNNFIVIASKCIEGMIFPKLALQTYRWSFSMLTAIAQLLILTPLFIYIKKQLSQAVEHDVNGLRWRYLWLIPSTFHIITQYSLYSKSLTSLEIALNPRNTILLLIINLGAFLVYCVIVRMVHENVRNIELEAKNHQLAMQSLQYENLRERVAEARRAKHDLRHHITLISGYSDKKDYDGLREYLNSFISTLPEDNSIVFCEHYTINMLILYFEQLAKENKIEFDVKLDIPAKISISDSDFCVIWGNLLENAIYACKAQKTLDRKIVLRGQVENERVLITVDNTYENEIRTDKDGVYISTKHEGTGIGVESVKAIAKRYEGFARSELKNGMFCISVMLKQNCDKHKIIELENYCGINN